MKRLLVKAISFCLIVILLLPSTVMAEQDIIEYVPDLQEELVVSDNLSQDDYSYVNYAAQIDEDTEYELDSIIVSMKKGASDINQIYTAEDFPELDVAYIEDLTYITNEELLEDESF